MKDLYGKELHVGDRVAFAKKGRQVGLVAVGTIQTIEPGRYYGLVAVIVDHLTGQKNHREHGGEMLWLPPA